MASLSSKKGPLAIALLVFLVGTASLLLKNYQGGYPLLLKANQRGLSGFAKWIWSVPGEKLNRDTPTILISSDRLDAIITTIGSLIRSSSAPPNIILIGQDDSNAKAQKHFLGRTSSFVTMTVAEAQADLNAQDHSPIWTWPEWHKSMTDPEWANNNTLRVAKWDHQLTHAHVLNHLRFYLPYLSVVRNLKSVFFLDDDLLVQKDLVGVAESVANRVSSSVGLTAACNIWAWNDDCHHFEFKSKHSSITESPPLYGDMSKCENKDDESCLPDNFDKFIQQAVPNGVDPADQIAWNFGFCLFHLDNWRQLGLTARYEQAMRLSYRLHEVPETSLVFGLGIPFLSLSGAVQCWNDEDMVVRDGFGFISWKRYQKTFGDDFFTSIDVAHYTGPSKPWTAKSSVEVNAIKPWLDMMSLEGLEVPEQHSTDVAKDLFLLITSPFSRSEWVMNMLDHGEVCASGERANPEYGWPTEALLTQNTPWLSSCSIKRSCMLGFSLDRVDDLTKGGSISNPPECQTGVEMTHNMSNKICNLIEALGGNFTKENVVMKWTQAYLEEDGRFLDCKCPRGTTIKGLQLMTDWLVSGSINHISNMADTAFKGSKVIRLKRNNLWHRYKSMLQDKAFALTQANYSGQNTTKVAQLQVSVERMIEELAWMAMVDKEADDWAGRHASDILSVDYDECNAKPDTCQSKMFEFLGVGVPQHELKDDGSPAFGEEGNLLQDVENAEEVIEALSANGYGSFIDFPHYTPLQFLVYETESKRMMPVQKMKGINVTFFGQGTNFQGFGSKYAAVIPVLMNLPEDSLVVLSDGRDVITNIPQAKSDGKHVNLYSSLANFRKSFASLTSGSDGAIVVSAEGQCCVAALGHIRPGDLFSTDGERTGRVCSSGSPGCEWNENEAQSWVDVMKTHAINIGQGDMPDIYLNAGLIGGKAKDLLRTIRKLDINEDEDDQAVLTAFMYRHPGEIILDYKQSMFGNNRWVLGEKPGCMFDVPPGKAKENNKRGKGIASSDTRLVLRRQANAPYSFIAPGIS
ncbi:hypothetical protein ACHAWF_016322 [Thalassiosira exigua]